MADNASIDPGTTPSVVVAADEIGGAKYQRVKPVHGADGSATDTSAAAPLPVADSAGATALASLLTELGQKLEPGDLSALATAAKQDTSKAVLDAMASSLATIVSQTDGLEATITDVDLNTDGLEASLTSLYTELGEKLEAGSLTGLATSAKQDTLIAKDFATQTTLAAVLAKLSADPATQTTLAAVLAAVDGLESNTTGLATQTTLAALLSDSQAKADAGESQLVASPNASSATVTQVSSSATSVTLKASNGSRKGLSVFNDSTANLFLKFGATASATSFTVKIGAGDFWEMPAAPVFTGVVDGIWSAANGNAYVTEL